MDALLRTASQFLYVACLVVAVPSLALLGWGLASASGAAAVASLGVTLGECAAAAAGSTVTANAVAFLRPDDMSGWMAPLGALLLLAFAGLMVLFTVLPS